MTHSLQRRAFTGSIAALGLGALLTVAAPFASAQTVADLKKKGELTVVGYESSKLKLLNWLGKVPVTSLRMSRALPPARLGLPST